MRNPIVLHEISHFVGGSFSSLGLNSIQASIPSAVAIFQELWAVACIIHGIDDSRSKATDVVLAGSE